MIVNELVTKFRFDVGRGFKNLDKRLKDSVKNTKGAVNQITAAWRAESDKRSKYYRDSMGRLRNENGRFVKDSRLTAKSVSAAFKSIFSSPLLGLAAGYFSFQGLNSVMSRTLKVGRENEQLFAGLSTLRGPQQATRDMRDLQTMAAKTPFQVGELTESFMRLNAAGFKVDIKDMQKLGDLAANTTGKSISDLTETMLSASRGQGAMVDNFNGMAGKAKDGGLEITSLDAKTGKLTTTMVKAGDKAALLNAYLGAASEQDTQGAMERLSQTMDGLASTLQDNINLALLQFYKALEPYLKQAAKAATQLVQDFQPLAKQFAVFIKLNLPRYIENIKNAFRILKPIIKVAAGVAAAFVATWLGFKILAVADLIMGAVGALRALKGAQVASYLAQLALNGAMALTAFGIGAAVIALGALAYDFYNFMETGDSALLRFTEKWPTLHDGIENVYLMVESLITGLEDMDSTTQWWADNSGMYLATLKNEYGILFDAIKTYIGSWIQYAIAKFDQFMLYGRAGWKAIKDAAQEAWVFISSSVMGVFNNITNWLSNLPSRAATAFGGLVTSAKNAVANMPVIGGAMQFLMRNKGGFIPGSGNRDTVPTMLTPGEFVINKPMVQSILSGNPKGLMQLQSQMRAPQMASTGSTAIAPQSVGSYSVPVGAMASGATNVTINAPITQTNNINGMGNSPSEVGAKLANSAMDRFNKGLSNAARQVPQRIARA